ncbi:MAG: hypothetical protein ND895_01835 [Pyrinomonadaceae bacterium]|nr:hypothetical protein [Pyrinomonadaceae bacterium]
MNKNDATKMRDHGLAAIRELTAAFNIAQAGCSEEECERIKRGVGLSIGRIQMELLEVINAEYPELDDLITNEESAN